MIKWLVVLFCNLLCGVLCGQVIEVSNLSVEGLTNPLGVDVSTPRFNWQLKSPQQNIVQAGYRLLVSSNEEMLNKNVGDIWDSKKVLSATSIQVAYRGSQLLSAKKYFWKVMVWDNKGNVSKWSSIGFWQMGLLRKSDWTNAKWIAYNSLPDSLIIVPAEHGNGKKEWGKRANVLPLFRKTFFLNKAVKLATVFISGLGQFEMSLNGTKVGDHFLDPGWTKYSKQVQYVTFDVTQQVLKGENVIGVILGNGFYYIPSERYRKMTGAYGYPKMIARMVVEYTDGTVTNIITDESWRTYPSPITYSSIYGGENYNATLDQQGWNAPGYVDSLWKYSMVAQPHPLVSQRAAPIKVMQQFFPLKERAIKNNVWVYDFGQNMSGIPLITVSGSKGDTVRLTPAELLKDDGMANQKATGSVSYYEYILKGVANETWSPRFSYYGFRYVQVDILPMANKTKKDSTKINSIQALHTRNSADSVSTFTCSNELFNKTYRLIKWAINSNMQSIFTDCPHRERLGWQEQLHLMGNALQYNYNIQALGKKIMADVRVEQNQSGLIPSTIPEYTEMHFANGYFRDSPEWGSSVILFPWQLYLWYGDKQELVLNYKAMQQYVNYLHSKDSSYLLMYGLSDWYDLGPARPGFCQLTPMGLTATAYYYYDLIILSKIASLLNYEADVKKYTTWAQHVKRAFNTKYYHANTKQYGTGSQTSNAIAVSLGLVEDGNKQAVINNIVDNIKTHNYALTSGDIGFHHLLNVLNSAGRSDVIFNMNNRTDVPGYGYQIVNGATALTESWQGLPIVSNNHFMLGHIMEWFYTSIGGIYQASTSTGYKEIIINPQPVGDVIQATTRFNSPYGLIMCTWAKKEKGFECQVEIPVNTTATIYVPSTLEKFVYLNGKKIEAKYKNGDLNSTSYGGKAMIKVGSGKYIINVLDK